MQRFVVDKKQLGLQQLHKERSFFLGHEQNACSDYCIYTLCKAPFPHFRQVIDNVLL